jgi:hypothetical protein
MRNVDAQNVLTHRFRLSDPAGCVLQPLAIVVPRRTLHKSPERVTTPLSLHRGGTGSAVRSPSQDGGENGSVFLVTFAVKSTSRRTTRTRMFYDRDDPDGRRLLPTPATTTCRVTRSGRCHKQPAIRPPSQRGTDARHFDVHDRRRFPKKEAHPIECCEPPRTVRKHSDGT